MKTVILLLSVILLTSHIPSPLLAQCAGGVAPSIISYDTTVVGNGSSSRTFSFPKFNPALGTLLRVDLVSAVSLSYAYTLENQHTLSHFYRTKIVRTDDITSPALDPASINAVNQTPFVTSPTLLPWTHSDYGPASMKYNLTNTVSDGRVVNFMGAGLVDFDYETGTSASVMGVPPFGLNFSSVIDTTHFTLTYRYCAASLLAADLLFFSATGLKDKVSLNWRQLEVELGRTYQLQVSTDGKNFSNIAVVPENNSGNYTYTYLHNASTRLYFRILQKNNSGEAKYSNIRIVDQEPSKTNVRVYPSLYTGGNLQVSFPYKADWTVNLYSAEGRKVAESRHADMYTTQISLPSGISNGVYTAEVVDLQTKQKQFTRIIIQR